MLLEPHQLHTGERINGWSTGVELLPSARCQGRAGAHRLARVVTKISSAHDDWRHSRHAVGGQEEVPSGGKPGNPRPNHHPPHSSLEWATLDGPLCGGASTVTGRLRLSPRISQGRKRGDIRPSKVVIAIRVPLSTTA